MAVFNLINGYNLAGFAPISLSASSKNHVFDPNVTVEKGYQIVRMTQTASGYFPNQFTIKKGIPVKWVIDSKDPNSCSASILLAKYNIRQNLQAGENIIEFTPDDEGQIRFSCGMGMYTGVFNVTGNNKAAVDLPLPTVVPAQERGGCGCSGGSQVNSKKVAGTTQIEANAISAPPGPVVLTAGGRDGSVQVIKTTYTAQNDLLPNEFTVKVGIPVRMEIDVRDNGSGCMSSIMIPKLVNDPKFLAKGTTIIFNFTPTDKGNYPITCAMGVPRGTIRVE
jgi:plastocyanin domain-containing protein